MISALAVHIFDKHCFDHFDADCPNLLYDFDEFQLDFRD